MPNLLSFVPLLGCGAMMVVCMLLMRGGMHRKPADPAETDARTSGTDVQREVAELRAEVDRLRADRAVTTSDDADHA